MNEYNEIKSGVKRPFEKLRSGVVVRGGARPGQVVFGKVGCGKVFYCHHW